MDNPEYKEAPQAEKRPLPHEHKEIARGSGPAAILLFLHIAAIGYLIYIAIFLLTGTTTVFWNLVPFKAGLIFYFPAAFAVFTSLPTDNLTRIVSRIAQIAGFACAVLYGAGLMIQWLTAGEALLKPGLITLCALAAGLCGGLLSRMIFSFGIGEDRLMIKKMRLETQHPE